MTVYQAATAPTLYFIGVTTTQSSIMKVFPAWVEYLGLDNAKIKGIDFPLATAPSDYRAAVQFIKNDSLSLGALVTTHKINLFKASEDLFDSIDPFAALMHETSCISKRGDKLVCHAKDPITAGLAIQSFVPDGHFARTGAEVFCLGCGGASVAITSYLIDPARASDVPNRIIVSDRDQERLEHIAAIHRKIAGQVPVEYQLVRDQRENDAVINQLAPGSLVINATGLGKDAPGSPITAAAQFPVGGFVWELNYRGDLVFLDQACCQQQSQDLSIFDGWTYFIHGWSQVIAEVFDIEIKPVGEQFDALSEIASWVTGR